MNRLQASHRRTVTTSTIAYDPGFGIDGQKHSSLKEIEKRSNNSLGEQPGRRVPVLDICINRVNRCQLKHVSPRGYEQKILLSKGCLKTRE